MAKRNNELAPNRTRKFVSVIYQANLVLRHQVRSLNKSKRVRNHQNRSYRRWVNDRSKFFQFFTVFLKKISPDGPQMQGLRIKISPQTILVSHLAPDSGPLGQN